MEEDLVLNLCVGNAAPKIQQKERKRAVKHAPNTKEQSAPVRLSAKSLPVSPEPTESRTSVRTPGTFKRFIPSTACVKNDQPSERIKRFRPSAAPKDVQVSETVEDAQDPVKRSFNESDEKLDPGRDFMDVEESDSKPKPMNSRFSMSSCFEFLQDLKSSFASQKVEQNTPKASLQWILLHLKD
jgi:hypothetical protein